MPDNDGNDNDSVPEIRKKLEAALAAQGEMQKQLDAVLQQNASLKGSNILHEAKLSHLTDKQREAVLKMHDGDELTVESILAVADDLGYKPQAPGQQSQQGNGQDGQDGQGGGEQNADLPPGAQAFLAMLQQAGVDATGLDPSVSQALHSMTRIEQANIAAQRPSSADFITKMKGAKTKEELESLIMAEGPAHGMVHEFDID